MMYHVVFLSDCEGNIFFFFSVATAVVCKLFIRVGQDHSRCLNGMGFFSSFTSFTGHSGSFLRYFFHWARISFELCHIPSETWQESFSEKCLQILCWGINIPLHNVDFVLWIRRYYMYLQLYTLHHQPSCNYEWSADEVFSLAHNNSLVQVQVQVTLNLPVGRFVPLSWVIHPHMQTQYRRNGQQMRIVQNTEIRANSN